MVALWVGVKKTQDWWSHSSGTQGSVRLGSSRELGLILLAASVVAVSCNDNTGPGEITTLEVAPASTTLVALGDTTRFTAVAKNAQGSVVGGKAVAWSSSNVSVATVEPGSGLATAVANGVVRITGVADGVSASATLTVAQAVTAVEVTPGKTTLVALGDTTRFAAVAKDAKGGVVGGKAVVWSSSNGLVATVEPGSGLATAVANGVVRITGVADGVSASATLTVVQLVAVVEVTPASITTWVGGTQQIAATPRDANGHTVVGSTVIWTSSDVAVATATERGLVTGVSIGSATITAESGGRTGGAAVTVERPRILVDASRDGGVWWFPQAGPFDPAAAHQGQALAEYLRSAGYRVDELPRPSTITGALLRKYQIVIRANGFGSYTQAEITAYREYVEGDGRLLLLGDHMTYAPPDGVALSFGLEFAGITRGENRLSTYASHPITDHVPALTYMVGSGIVASPPSAQILGWLSSNSYLDLDANGAQDPGEPAAPAVLGAMTYGSGRIVFCGDTNLWEQIPLRLVTNVLAWFKGS